MEPVDETGQVQRAGEIIQRNLALDETISTDLDCYVYRRETLSRTRYMDIPQAILDSYDQLSCKSFLGIFSEINRVYITIDNRLFLWNYRDGSYYVFDELGQIIISVGLVKPKPGVFVDDIVYLLVIATPTEIILLGVRFDGDSVYGDIELVPTSYFVSSDNVHMLKIIGTPAPSSRIFLCGKDGCVYEVDYSSGSRWLSSKCRKLNHGSMGQRILHVLPFQFLQSDNPIVDMIISPSRGIMYALTNDSSILKYNLGVDFSVIQGPLLLSSIGESAMRAEPGIAGSSKDFRIVALAVADNCADYDVVAITNHAHRLFLQCDSKGSLVVRSVRVCPRYVSSPYPDAERERLKPFYSKGQSPQEVRTAILRDGTMVASDLRDSDADTLLCFTTRPNASESTPSDSRESKEISCTDENVEAHQLEAHVCDIQEQPLDFYLTSEVARSLYKHDSDSPVEGLSVFATQHALPPREFLVLSSLRLSVFAQSRPVDELRQILAMDRNDMLLQSFFHQYGAREACAMCLILACSSSTRLFANGGDSDVFQIPERRLEDTSALMESDYSNPNGFCADARLKQAAIDAFQTYGGESFVHQKSQQVVFSARHDGLYAYLSRVLRSVWLWSIVVESPTVPNLFTMRFAPCTWKILLSPLLQLDRFLQDYPQNRLYSGSRSKELGAEAASTMEIHSITNLLSLLSRSIEVLRLTVLIAETDTIVKVIQNMDRSDVYALNVQSVRDLVSTSAGCRTLQALIRSFMDQHASADRQLIEELQRSCPSFIDRSDLYLFQANLYIHAARSAVDQPARRKRNERDAIDSYKRASSIVQFPLMSTLDKLRDLGLYRGIVELCLHRAALLRALEQELQADEGAQLRRGAADDVRQTRQTIVMKRQSCYTSIVQRLDELDARDDSEVQNDASRELHYMDPNHREQALRSAIEACLGSNDDEFLKVYFFPWYIERFQSFCYEISCEAFEQYLRSHRAHLDRLKLYYMRLRMYGKAAAFFYGLALDDSVSERFSLPMRSQFLETSIECTKYFGPDDDSSLIFELRRALNYSEIQQDIVHKLSIQKASNEDAREAWERLSSFLLPAEELYNVACQFRCFEECLAILYTEDSREHTDVINTFWSNIIQLIIQEKESKGSDWRLAIREKVSFLGRQYRETRFMFPIESICALLERFNATRTVCAPADVTLVTNIMLHDVGVQVDQLIPVYSNIIRQWSGCRDSVFGSVAHLLSPANIDSLHQNSSGYRRAIEDALDLLDLCLNYEPTNRHELAQLRGFYTDKKVLF